MTHRFQADGIRHLDVKSTPSLAIDPPHAAPNAIIRKPFSPVHRGEGQSHIVTIQHRKEQPFRPIKNRLYKTECVVLLST